MAKLRIYNEIVNEEERVMLSDWYGVSAVCYKDIADFLQQMDPEDEEIDIRMHCIGGSCAEGWAIYDALRQSGKKISATVEGECASMAAIVLMAAPKERRYAYSNAMICIHYPAFEWLDGIWSDHRLDAVELTRIIGELQKSVELLNEEGDKAVALLVERTGTDEQTIREEMAKDHFISTTRAIELGIIGSTLAPITDSKKNKNNKTLQKGMEKKTTVVEQSKLNRLLAKCGLKTIEEMKMVDIVVTTADGTELTVEREEGDPQVGDVAYPDGTHVLTDGTTIVVENEVITSITAPQSDEDLEKKVEELQQTVEELQKKVEELEADNAEKDQALAQKDGEAKTENDELQQKVTDLESQVSELQQKVDELEESNKSKDNELEEKQRQIDEKEGSRILSEDENSILEKVSKAGGIQWLETVMKLSSGNKPAGSQFQEHGNNAGAEESKTQKMIREQREAAEAKRKQRIS